MAGHRVLTFGPDGRLECRAIIDGSLLWEVDTSATYHVVQNFFGVGTAPLVVGPLRVGAEERTLVVVQVGGSREGANPAAPERLDLVKGLDSGLVAFDIVSGAEVWRATNQLASYSVPVLVTIGGRPLILAWMRDELVAVEPATGKLLDRFRWRSDELFSVVAASPVVSGDQVLLSECYGPGSVLLALENDSFREVRRDKPGARPRQALKTHWNTPVLRDGYVYGSSGRNAGDAQLVCVNWATGVVGWSEGGLGRSSVTLVDDHLLILGDAGKVRGGLARPPPRCCQRPRAPRAAMLGGTGDRPGLGVRPRHRSRGLSRPHADTLTPEAMNGCSALFGTPSRALSTPDTSLLKGGRRSECKRMERVPPTSLACLRGGVPYFRL